MRFTTFLIIGFLPIAALAADGTPTVKLVSSEARTVTVDAIAIAKAAPDKLELRLKIRSVQPTVKESQSAVTTSLQRLLAGLRSVGVEEQALMISDMEQGRESDWADNKRVFKGFYAALDVRLTITDFALLPRIQSNILSDDLIEVKSMDRVSNHEGELRQKALADAAAVARKKAEILATALGAKVGGVIQVIEKSFEESELRGNRSSGNYLSNDAREASTAEVQEISVRAAVNVQFELVK